MLALEVGDREAADGDIVRRVELVPDVHHAAVQRHRGGLQLERAARLIGAPDSSVEAALGRRGAHRVGVVVGQADHRQDLAGVNVHDDAAAADGARTWSSR